MIRFEDKSGSACAVSMCSISGQAMPQSYLDSGKTLTNLGQDATSRLRSFLRAVHPRKTAEGISADTGISVGTVSAWLKGISAPSFTAYTTLIDVYGVELLSAVLPRNIAVREAARQHKRKRLTSDIADLNARLEALS